MRKVSYQFCVRALMLLMSLLALNKGYSQTSQPYECKIQNINLVSPTIMEFDVYIKNTGGAGGATLLLNAFQGGVDFNYTGMAGGGTITGAFVAGSNALPAPQSAPNWNINATSKQIRLIAAVVTAPGSAAAITSTPLKLGTFRMTNTLPFASCATPDFSWSFITGANKTKTGVTAWVNGGTSPVSITSTTHAAATFANGGGPQHYVDSNPAITCCPSSATYVGTDPLCYGGTGSAIVTITGASSTASGTYSVDGGASQTFSSNPFTISDLTTGGHSIQITPASCTSFSLGIVTGGPTAPATNVTNATACDTYNWAVNGLTYTQSGTYTGTSTNANGCQVAETLNLTINASSTTTASACGSYTWAENNQTYSNSGTYTSGCNTLVLTITGVNTTSASACDSYTWAANNQTYTSSGTYTSGCDELILTINSSTSSTDNATACDSYTWVANGQTYTSSGVYSATSTNASGCPHTSTLNLTINSSTSNTTSATACNSYTWLANGMTYTASGSYTATSTNAAGCPHTETLNLTINSSTSNTTSATACDSYNWAANGMTYTTSGTYNATSTNAAGCPHTETLNLTINNSTSSTVTATACGSYLWSCNGQTYTQSGSYTCTGTNAAGCTETTTLDLTINSTISPVQNETACDSFTWGCNGQTYTQSGSYTCNTTGSNGCPSVITLNLTINNSTSNTSNVTACDSYSWVVNGMTYTASGTYTATSTNVAGCSHTETLNLTINSSSSSTTTASACDSYIWAENGMTYTQSGTYSASSTNAAGCPHTATLNLTVNSSTSNTTSATACDSYTWSVSGTTYTQSGTYTSTSTNASGCPHTETLNLTINSSSSNSTSATACDSYLWSVDGMTYTTSGIYTATSTNASGCSHTETLDLTINNSTSTTVNETACNTFTWSCDGQTYTQSGIYTCTGTNAAGCPSTTTLNLTINNSTTSTVNATACTNYTWSCNGQTYTQSGTYTCIGTNASGCTQTNTLILTINNCNVPQTLPYECTIQNIHLTSSNVMEFDVYIKNTGTNTLKMNAFQGGIDFNYTGMAGTGTITGAFVPGSNSLPAPQNNPNWNINATSKQIRLLASVITSSSVAATIPTTPMKLGTFRMTNTVPFAPCSTPNFTWSFVTATNKTKTAVTTWINTGTSPVSITDPTHPAASFANGGGPQHFVQSNEVVNCCPSSASYITNDPICFGDLGSAEVTVTGPGSSASTSGTYTVDGGSPIAFSSNPFTITGLSTGSHNIVVDPAPCPSFNFTLVEGGLTAPLSNTSNVNACDSYVWGVNGQTYTQSGTYTTTSTNVNGCVVNETLNLTINSSSTSVDNVTACDTYNWACNGQTYTQSGTYTCTGTNAAGCPHTTTLNLTINNSTSSTESAVACDSYTWACNNLTYTQSGTYTCLSTNTAGCTHTTTLNLVINNSTSNTLNASACNTYTWACNNQTYTQSGTYTCMSTNTAGCSETNILNLTINTNTTSSTQVTACDSYTWNCNNQTYSQSGIYTCLTQNAAGCAHVATLNLTVNYSTTGTAALSACNSFTWSCNGQTYNQSGNYTCVGLNSAGCPHTTNLALTVNQSTSSTQSAVACNSYTWSCNGQTYTQSGSYTCTSTNSAGCPHVTTLNLVINNSTSSTQSATACNSYTWNCNGQTYTQSGVYTCNSVNSAGCIQTNTLVLTINSSTTTTFNATACNTYTWGCNGQTYNQSGSYTCITTNAAGCPQVNILNLIINNSTTSTVTASACNSYFWNCNGQNYTQSGNYTCTTQNSNGCPHITTLQLTINHSTSSQVNAFACNSYAWSCNNVVYTNSGVYNCYGLNSAGCQHVTTLYLSLGQSTTTTTNITACNNFTWSCNGQTYTQSGSYTCVTTNGSGCSQVNILNLTINQNTTTTVNATACNSYTWSCNGQTYNQSGTYTCISQNSAGCTLTSTLNLVINNSTTSTQNVAVCNSYTWSCNNQSYAQSGTYTCVSTNASGCPQINILNLTINSSTSNTTYAGGCNSYTWNCNGQTYTQSGQYVCNTQNAGGCLQVNILNLSINYSTTSSQTASSCVSYTWGCNNQTYTTSGTKTCISTNSSGCPHTATLNLIINPLPTVTAATVTTCSGSPVTLVGSPAGGSFSLPNPYLGNANTYQYTYTSSTGCFATATGNIVYSPAITINNLAASSITGSSAVISWSSSGVTFDVRYKPNSSSTWINGTSSSSLTRTLSNLTANTIYSVQVRGYCSTTSAPSDWVGIQFTTTQAAGCATPVPTTTTLITASGAKLNWASSAANFNLRYRKVGVTTWTTTPVTGLTKTLTGLLAASTYEFQVQAKCTATSLSSWSTTATFTTLANKMPDMEPVAEATSNFTIYPNPTRGLIKAEILIDKSSQLDIDVIDMTGRKVKQYTMEAGEGINQYQFDFSELTTGIYTIRFFQEGQLIQQAKVTKSE